MPSAGVSRCSPIIQLPRWLAAAPGPTISVWSTPPGPWPGGPQADHVRAPRRRPRREDTLTAGATSDAAAARAAGPGAAIEPPAALEPPAAIEPPVTRRGSDYAELSRLVRAAGLLRR